MQKLLYLLSACASALLGLGCLGLIVLLAQRPAFLNKANGRFIGKIAEALAAFGVPHAVTYGIFCFAFGCLLLCVSAALAMSASRASGTER